MIEKSHVIAGVIALAVVSAMATLLIPVLLDRAEPDAVETRGRKRNVDPSPTPPTTAKEPAPAGIPAVVPTGEAKGEPPSRTSPPERKGEDEGKAPIPNLETKIEEGLKKLLARQRPDGSWEGVLLEGTLVAEPATTALSVLAFLGAGEVPGAGDKGEALKRALEFLLSVQTPSGMIGGTFHDHHLATLALAEAFGLTQDTAYLEPLQKALDYSAKTRESGAWSANYTGGNHVLFETAWGALANKSGSIVGGRVDHHEFHEVDEWLSDLKVDDPEGGAALSAARVMCSGVSDGVRRRMEAILEKVSREKDFEPGFHFLYFGSLAAFRLGGDVWKKWSTLSDKAFDRFEASREKAEERNVADPLLLLAREIRYRYSRARGK